jgi:molecular chaperone DnaK (HSP70)
MTTNKFSPARSKLDQPIPPEQRTELRTWANSILSKVSYQIRDIRTSCSDGVAFLHLLELLTGHPITPSWDPHPATLIEKRKNVTQTLTFLQSNGYLPENIISSDDILWGEEKFSLFVLKSLHSKFSNTRKPPLTSLKGTNPISASKPSSRPASQPNVQSKFLPSYWSMSPAQLGPIYPEVVIFRPSKKKTEPPPDPPKPVKKNRIFDIGHDPRVFKWERKPVKPDIEGSRKPRRRAATRRTVLGELAEPPEDLYEEEEDLISEDQPEEPIPIENPPEIITEIEETPPPPPSWEEVAESNPEEALVIALEEPPQLPKSLLCAGIDFGTSGCRFAIFTENGLDPRVNAIPSIVTFTEGERQIGGDRTTAPSDSTVVAGSKRLIGHEFDEATDYEASFGYPITKGPSNLPVINVNNQQYSPEQITAMVLGQVKTSLADQLQEEVVDAVVTVPAYFTNSQRQATMDAASIAGFNVLRLQNESVAALLAKPHDSSERYLVVIDFGGGKLDLSLVHQVDTSLTILRTAGDTQFGGMDLDRAVADVISKDIPTDLNIPRRQLLAECQKARENLSQTNEITLTIGEFSRTLNRNELNEILTPFYEKIITGLNDLFENNRITKENVKEVHVVGGMAKVPEVIQLINDYFPDSTTVTTANETAVVVGAAIEGAILKEIGGNHLPKVQVRQTTPLSSGFSNADGTWNIVIPRGSVLPARKSTTATTSRDNQRNVGFEIIEGERKMAKDNVRLGSVVVDGIENAPRAVPKIEITMEINEDGILVVTAIDTKTGTKITSTIESASNLSKSEINGMIAEAEAHKTEDNRILKRTQWRTRLATYVDSLLQKETQDEEQRELLVQNVEVWKKWNREHENELIADVYIRQYFEVRKTVKEILA